MVKSRNQLQTSSARTSCPLQRDNLVPIFCDVFPSTAATVDEIVGKVTKNIAAVACSPEDIEDVELALREALANAIIHGNQNDPTKRVAIACFCESERGLLIVVRDEGPGFDPAQVPDPTAAENIYLSHGRGIFLMQELMDKIEYRDGGREVELRKERNPESPPSESRDPSHRESVK